MAHKTLSELKYAKTHEWIKVEGDFGYIGISDYAQSHLGDVVFVDLPNEGDQFDKEEAFGAVESVKAASDLFMPVSGTIVEVNEALNDEPELLNQDAYKNYVIKIKITNKEELNELLDEASYKLLEE